VTDADDKTGRHGNWANKVPLMTLLAIVFAAGGLFVKQQFIESKVDRMLERWDRFATASEARQRAIEDWKIIVETREQEAQRLAREQERAERKKQR